MKFPRALVSRQVGATLILAGLAILLPALAAEGESKPIDWLSMGTGLLGGLALFLFGMEQLADSLKAMAGEGMKQILERLTKNWVMAALTGALVTAVIQSSSITTVLVVGFVTAGLMSMSQSVGIIMGANVGTTITAQIVAFKVTAAALPLIAIGFGMLFMGKREHVQHYGAIVMGLGLIFFGMGIMSETMDPLRAYQPFLDLMAAMQKPLLGILIAAVFTALIQSSSATTGIVIVMASQGFITLEAGIAMALGANVGTCVTALLAAIGKPTEAVRAAVVHVLFNVLGALLWLPFIAVLASLAIAISPFHPELSGSAQLAADAPRQIANANTLFNIFNTFIFIGFSGLFARLVVWLVPERPKAVETVIIEPQYLDEELLETPTLALERVRMEVGRLGGIAESMVDDIRAFLQQRNEGYLERIAEKDDQIDVLEKAILSYLNHIRQTPLSDKESITFQKLMTVTVEFINLAEGIANDFVALGRRILALEYEPTETTRLALQDLYNKIHESVRDVVQAVRKDDAKAAQRVVNLKGEIRRLVEEVYTHQSHHVTLERPEQVQVIRIELEVVEKMRRIYTLAKRIARQELPQELASKS